MTELLRVWLVEGIVGVCFLWPLGIVFVALGNLKADRRSREARRVPDPRGGNQ